MKGNLIKHDSNHLLFYLNTSLVHFNMNAKYPFHNPLHLELIQLTTKKASTLYV